MSRTILGLGVGLGVSVMFAVASGEEPPAVSVDTVGKTLIVRDDVEDTILDEPSQQLGLARQSFLMLDLGATAKRLRTAAANLRVTSAEADEAIKPRLDHSADELDSLAGRVEKGEVESVVEIDRPSARALQRLSRHHYLAAQRAWLKQQRKRAGTQLRAAVDNLEHAAKLSGEEVQTATRTAVADVPHDVRKTGRRCWPWLRGGRQGLRKLCQASRNRRNPNRAEQPRQTSRARSARRRRPSK